MALQICDIDLEKGERLAGKMACGSSPAIWQKKKDIVSMVKGVGSVQLLVNNGGISGPMAPVADININEWRYVLKLM